MKYLILGNGAAGTEAALSIRKVDPDSPIVLLTESRYLHYYRPKLVHFLAEEQTNPDSLIVYKEDFYSKQKIFNVLGRKVAKLDVQNQTVWDEYGGVYPYEKLLIATGSKPFVPPIPGIQKNGVFTLRSITDAQKIKKYTHNVDRVVVIGGGLLGLENAFSLSVLGKEVTVIEAAPTLLPRQLDENGGRHLERLLQAKGLNFVLGQQVQEFVGKETVEGVRLKDGTIVPCQAVLVSAGIRGDMDFLQGTPIEVNRGIVVDDFLRTSVPNVYAAGDVAEHRGVTYGLWTVAREQGKLAGLNMAGEELPYLGSLPSSLLKITGINVFSMGDVRAEAVKWESSDEQSYKKLLLKDDQAVAAMVVGDKSAIPTAQRVMAGKATPEEFLKHFA